MSLYCVICLKFTDNNNNKRIRKIDSKSDNKILYFHRRFKNIEDFCQKELSNLMKISTIYKTM